MEVSVSGGAASKAKGSSFERAVCAKLSLWITEGKRKDVFWRSAMSGGRATVHGKGVRQAGDIAAVAPEGHPLTDWCFIECKHYANLDIVAFAVKGKGTLAKFWRTALKEAAKRGKRPWLIARQNRLPTLLLTIPLGRFGLLEPLFTTHNEEETCVVWDFDSVMSIKPPKELLQWQDQSSALTGTAPSTTTRVGGRRRILSSTTALLKAQ